MSRSRMTAVGISIGLALLLTLPDQGLAQGTPYRMRFPTSSLGGGRPGASVRPPRLVGSPDDTGQPSDGLNRRRSDFYQDFGWYYGSYGYEYADDSIAEAYSSETKQEMKRAPSLDVYPVYESVPEPGPLEVSTRRIASGILVRLNWTDNGLDATQVAFFLADSAKAVLSAQTDRTPPFMAEFQSPARAAFAGMTVVLPNGDLVTRFVSYRQPTP